MKNPNELSATSSWRGNELQLIEQKANIVVGVANSRTRLRIGVLLSKYSEYQVEPGKRIRCPLPSNAFRPRREASCR